MISFRGIVVAVLASFAGASNLRAADPVEKLHGTGRALQNQSSSIEYAACSFQESYNFDDVGKCGGDTTTWVPLSQYVACISSFQLDKNNATQYLESMINATKDFYIFTDIAINPRLSEPKTTMSDYPIYEGTGSGQVDLIKEMEALIAEVKEKGATLNLFLQVQDIYSKLQDAHVHINEHINTAGMFGEGNFGSPAGIATSEKLSGEADSVIFYVVYPTPNEEFILMANITDTNNVSETKQIISIDDMEPLEFFVKTSSKAPFFSPFKSLGPRVQNLIKGWIDSEGPFSGSLSSMTEFNNNLASIFQDNYDIIYADGTQSKWHLLQEVPCPVSAGKSTDEIEEDLTKPGKLYMNYQDARDQVSAIYQSLGQRQRKLKTMITDEDRQLQEMSDGSVEFTEYPFTSSDGLYHGTFAFAIFSTYAVLKVADFFEYPAELMLQAWTQMSNEAAAKGVTNLIIDIIGNGGGTVPRGYELAQLMYPSATWDDFANPYDMLYSPPIDVYLNEVKPLLDDLPTSANQSITDALNKDPGTLVLKLNETVNALLAMADVMPSMNAAKAANATSYILDNVQERSPPSILEGEVNIILREIDFIDDTSPVKMFYEDGTYNVDDIYPVEYVRGGKTGLYTSVTYQYSPNQFIDWQKNIQKLDNPYQFDQFLILADGNGVGSTTATFQNTVSEYAKSHAGSVAPTHTVSFGGSGKQGDAAVTQFPGGGLGDSNLAPLYAPFFALFVSLILAQGSPYSVKINDTLVNYEKVIPEPCYYCDAPSSLTFLQLYSDLVGTNSIPLEYTDVTPDYYIKQWPTQTSLKDDSDLPDLYAQTSAFFVECPGGCSSSASTASKGFFLLLACVALTLSLAI